MIIENVKYMKLNRKIVSVVLNTQILRMIWQKKKLIMLKQELPKFNEDFK